mgnify:CR=1 FL=1
MNIRNSLHNNYLHWLLRTFSLVLLSFASFYPATVYSQDCDSKIIEAKSLYELGQFNEVIKNLSYCADSADRDTRWKSLRLIALSQLANKDVEEARLTAIKMMEINPKYKPSSLKEPSDFVQLINDVVVIPKFSIGVGLSLGTNVTAPTVNDVFTVSDQGKKYTGSSKFQIGISSLYQINSAFSVQTSLVVSRKAFELDHSFGDWSLGMEENMTYLHVPIRARYTFSHKSRIQPFVQLGGYGGLLLFSNNSFFAQNNPSNESYSLENVSSIDRRNKMDFGLTGGVGVNYTTKNGLLFAQVNYFRSSQNITNEDTRYQYNELFYSYFYLDDNIVLNNYSASIGYSLYLNYKVVK